MASLTSAPSRAADGDDAPGAPSPDDVDIASDAVDRRAWAVVGVAVAGLLGLATWGLGRKSLWVDEAISLGATHELVRTWKGTGGTMALYYALLRVWGTASEDPAWLRALSVLFAVAAVPFIWSTARRAFDRRVAAIAAAFTVLSPLVVRYAQEARSYALVLLLTSISWCALVATARADEADDPAAARRWWAVFTVATVLAPLAHGLAALQLLGQVAFVAAAPDRRRWFDRLKVVVIGVVAVTVVLVAFGASDVASWIPPISISQAHAVLAAFTGPALGAQVVLVAAAALGVWTCLQRRRSRSDSPVEAWFSLLPVAWTFVPIGLLLVGSILRPYLLARYVAASAPGLAILLAVAVAGPKPRIDRARAAAIAVPIVLALAVGQVQLHAERGDDWRGAAATVRSEAAPSDLLVLPNPFVRSAFDAAWDDTGFDGGAAPTAFSPIEPVGHVRRFYTIHEPTKLAHDVAATGAERVWIVDQTGIGFDDTVDPFIRNQAIAGRYDVAFERRFSDGIRVVLLQRS